MLLLPRYKFNNKEQQQEQQQQAKSIVKSVYSSDTFRIPNCLKQGDALSLLLFNFALEIKTAMENADN
jgi:hypothetical protein